MTVLDTIAVPNADDAKSEALTVVVGTLGLSKAAFFCRHHLARQTDYLKFKEETSDEESVARLAARIAAERTVVQSQ